MHNEVEFHAAGQFLDFLKISMSTCRIGTVVLPTHNSALLNETKDITAAASVVPMRNPIFLSIAAVVAAEVKATAIWFGATLGDQQDYADCRQPFIHAFHQMLKTALGWDYPPIIAAPFIDKTKTEIVHIGQTEGLPFEKTWTCYRPQNIKPWGQSETKVHACGTCPSCLGRLRAFSENHLTDPIPYI